MPKQLNRSVDNEKNNLTVCSFVLILLTFNVSVFANEVNVCETLNSDLAKESIIEEVEGLYNTNGNERATGLIVQKTLTLSKTSTQLIITAKTTGTAEVTKCGFTYIRLQRLISGTWTDYTAYCYYDQYSNSNTKTFSKSISAPKGYTYRVVCEHYAEKPRLFFGVTSETSYNQTSSLIF